jgi:hypothetical protein
VIDDQLLVAGEDKDVWRALVAVLEVLRDSPADTDSKAPGEPGRRSRERVMVDDEEKSAAGSHPARHRVALVI